MKDSFDNNSNTFLTRPELKVMMNSKFKKEYKNEV